MSTVLDLIIKWWEHSKDNALTMIVVVAVQFPLWGYLLEEKTQVKLNTERIKYYDEYIKESEASREYAIQTISNLIIKLDHQNEKIEAVQEGIDGIVQYNKEQQERIQKFYYLNPSIKNPRVHSDLVIKEGKNAN